MPIVIDPIKRKTFRPRSQFDEELLEGPKAKLDVTSAGSFPSQGSLG